MRDGRILGEGYHHRAGGAHAETNALRDVRDASGSTHVRVFRALQSRRAHARVQPRVGRCRREPGRRRRARSQPENQRCGRFVFARARRPRGRDRRRTSARDDRALRRIGRPRPSVPGAQDGDVARRLHHFGTRRARMDHVGRGAALRPRPSNRARRGDGGRGNGARGRSDVDRASSASSLARLRPRGCVQLRRRGSPQPHLRPGDRIRENDRARAGRRPRSFRRPRPGCRRSVRRRTADAAELDLAAALCALRAERGVQSVLCEGGPTLAGGLVAADLCDRLGVGDRAACCCAATAPCLRWREAEFRASVCVSIAWRTSDRTS